MCIAKEFKRNFSCVCFQVRRENKYLCEKAMNISIANTYRTTLLGNTTVIFSQNGLKRKTEHWKKKKGFPVLISSHVLLKTLLDS